MTRAVLVRYRTRPDAAHENERLVKAVWPDRLHFGGVDR